MRKENILNTLLGCMKLVEEKKWNLESVVGDMEQVESLDVYKELMELRENLYDLNILISKGEKAYKKYIEDIDEKVSNFEDKGNE
jgi:hypothetical protein